MAKIPENEDDDNNKITIQILLLLSIIMACICGALIQTNVYNHIKVNVGITSKPGINSSIKTIIEAILPFLPAYISFICFAA